MTAREKEPKGKSETALYRKYRPQEFKDVIGQDHIISVLKSSIDKKSISHAYLFSGSRGTGKTSVARIFAKEIGCSPNDLYEIDAASNRGIDDIREIRESVHTVPLESPYKVYLVDEVHMLTKEAFNALLKTLEEPPQHVIFILATTEMEKVPETVLSRCQIFQFRKPTEAVLKEMLTSVAKKEGVSLDGAAAELIALLGDGSFRDTLGNLQKVLTTSGDKKITVEEVEEITGAPKNSLVNGFLEAVGKRELTPALKTVGEASRLNTDPKIFLKLALAKMRFVLLLKYAPELEKVIKEKVSESDLTLLKTLSEDDNSGINSQTLYELLGAYDMSGRSYIPELPIELALIKSFTVK